MKLGLLPPLARLEFIVSLAMDALEGKLGTPSSARSIAAAASHAGVDTLLDVDPRACAELPAATLRRWQVRLDVAGADPRAEWDRDVVRMAVVRPAAGVSVTLRLGDITQPWLRDVVTQVCQTRLNSVSPSTLSKQTLAVARLSAYLRTRADQGGNARALTRQVVDAWVAQMRVSATPEQQFQALRDVSAVFGHARALGLTDRYGLSTAFAVRQDDYPKIRKRVVVDRGFPDATFRFLLGADDLLGPRVLDLARSVPGTDSFRGEMFVTAIHLAANFGRRPEELCSLRADRIRIGDSGAAELLYDNFKSGRDRVWLPVDARSAQIVHAWKRGLRERYPQTASEDLALLPRRQQNLLGTQATGSRMISHWWRVLVSLLEEAIVIAIVVDSTGADLNDVCGARMSDMDGRDLVLKGNRYPLSDQTHAVLTDYKRDVVVKVGGKKYAPSDMGDLPLFLDPAVRPGGLINKRVQTQYRAVDSSRFTALGDGWISIAAQYKAGGIPGFDLGDRRIRSAALQMRLFRHTYLQHLVNIGTDIFVVQELADHANVQTTIDSYVRVQDERLQEAVDLLARHRLNNFGVPTERAASLPSIPAGEVAVADCANPQVLQLGREGCENDRMCFGCDFLVADPSHIPDIRAEIHTCNLTLARLDAQETPLKSEHEAILRYRRDGWQRLLGTLVAHLDSLAPDERARIATAADIVREFRTRARAGGVNLGFAFGGERSD
ncbi:tyrosine-type recombinase/integrase [Nocardioides sp. CER19]|uniref:tyrosine-type recombinase/integrase n=1 Tax=Nocardioides sp. CER19 TaxID=3038538 RepID=UPI002446FB66|nr:tyrosine-type recombinase/integrase [Nocardioides sp. CER19]MDH2413939.1 hypothetical protein [Nocardioides sp. CER19]